MVGSGVGFKKMGLVLLTVTLSSCGLLGRLGRQGASGGMTLTPPSYYTAYYSTQKARYLGEKYGHNLERLVEQVARGPVGKLQFANSIVSISMGFFTHSASQTPDARYIEVLIGMPDILEEKTDFIVKVDQLFTQYGRDLLSILSSDLEIATDEGIAGYGLNFSWRNIDQTPSGPRLTLEGAVIYIPKEKAYRFVKRLINQEELLRSSVFFARQGEQPARLVRPALPSPQP